MVLPFVFGQRQQQAHPGTIEKAHPGRLEQELHPKRIAVERDGTRQIVDADIDLADLGQAWGNDWAHQVSSLGGRAAVDLARPSRAGRLTAAWIRRITRASLSWLSVRSFRWRWRFPAPSRGSAGAGRA